MEFYRSYYSSSADFIDTCNQLLVCLVGVVTSFALIYKINIFMILIILATCVAEFFLLKYLNKKEKGVKDKRSNIFVKLDYYYSLSKDLTAAKDIRLYGFTDYFIFSTARLIQNLENITSKYMYQSVRVGGTRALLNFVRELVTYAYLTYLVCQNKLFVSDFIFYFGIITGFSNWIMNAVYQYSNIERCCNDCKAFREFVESREECRDRPNVDFSDVESIEFKDVSFKYPGAENYSLKNINIKINSGEKLAVVGRNGSGKTTFIKLMCRLYDATEGEILINGINIKDYTKESIMRLYSVVFQDFKIFSTTLSQNISAGEEYDYDKLYQVLNEANIKDRVLKMKKRKTPIFIRICINQVLRFQAGRHKSLHLQGHYIRMRQS